MPMYEYQCPRCQEVFELLRSMSERDEECRCPNCGHEARMERKSSLFASTGGERGGGYSSCGPSSSGFG
ncbi:MAG: zinc ribbon domain-containing protein [Deltaproteobacteria bacterium]|nr:MAG: zinc ribbon domain-containing protein [Deltaproteobacteria bacterium]